MGTTRHHVDASTREAILEDLRTRRSFEPYALIAEVHNVHVSVVARLARKHGLTNGRQPGRKPAVKARPVVKRLFEEAFQDHTLESLSEQLGYAYNTVNSIKNGSEYGGLGILFALTDYLGYELKLEKINERV